MEVQDIYLFHITHVDNLSSILEGDCLYSDAESVKRDSCMQQIGMSKIKMRRLHEIEVSCHPGTKVGEYVPFYFWHHSPMLYLIHKGSDELLYKGGQSEIVHLVSKMQAGIEWADSNKRKWAFTAGNAGAYFCDFYDKISDIDKVNWDAVQKKFWTDCRDEKQAEFLVEHSFPFSLFTHIVTYNNELKEKVESIVSRFEYNPEVLVRADWYY